MYRLCVVVLFALSSSIGLHFQGSSMWTVHLLYTEFAVEALSAIFGSPLDHA
jgi:hypothetical protein